jgi:glutamate racemase
VSGEVGLWPSSMNNNYNPIGVFDSGYGGLTVLKEFVKEIPGYDFVYLGDNARNPYGNRSFETVYNYSLQAIKALFSMGCNLIIVACNTASAKALRSIQQIDLPKIDCTKRVLGVIRPTVEILGKLSRAKRIGIVGTIGTINSESYLIEIRKFSPEIKVYQEACPMWVPLVENNEIDNVGADYFVKKNLENLFVKDSAIDTLVLGCTHYPLLMPVIRKFIPAGVTVVSQDLIVAKSLRDYLRRHPKMDSRCSKNNTIQFYTTDSTETFDKLGKIFFNRGIVNSKKIKL